MNDEDRKSDAGVQEGVSDAIPAAASLDAPRPRGRPRSPTPTQRAAALEFKVATQVSRLIFLEEALADSAQLTVEKLTLGDLEEKLSLLSEEWSHFSEEHKELGTTCDASFFKHTYMTTHTYDRAYRTYRTARSSLMKLKSVLTSRDHAHPQPRMETTTGDSSSRNLAVSYRKLLFPRSPSMVIDNTQLAKVEKMHYLRTSLAGPAAQLIENLPVSGDAFDSAWAILTSRFENRRLPISAQLDKLTNSPVIPSRSAHALNELLTTVADGLNALEALGSPVAQWDQLLVHLVTQKLDLSTREAWEVKLGSSTEFPSFDRLKSFLTGRACALERLESASAQSKREDSSRTAAPSLKTRTQQPVRSYSAPTQRSGSTTQEAPVPYPCDLCDGDHYVVQCATLKNLSVPSRLNLVQTRHLCYNCMGHHSVAACRSSKTCKTCGPHAHHSRPNVLLATALAELTTQFSTTQVRLLIDAGSELRFISDRLVTSLNLRRQQASIPVVGIGGTEATHTRGVTQVTLRSLHSSQALTISTFILNRLTTTLPTFSAPQQEWPLLRQLQLADPNYFTPRKIDLIIGADSYGSLIKAGLKKRSQSSLIAQRTIFGWILLGPVSDNSGSPCLAHHIVVQHSDNDTHHLLQKFWTQEELPISSTTTLAPEEQACEDHFLATHSRDSSGRYIVRLPLNAPLRTLGASLSTAQKCLKRLLGRLSRNDSYNSLYSAFLREYEDLHHMKRTDFSSTKGSTHYYLPHHGVLREDSLTTKLRVVFNGSSSTDSGSSLNDILHTGAKLQADIFDILLWIRRHRWIFVTDITKMFRQILVHPDDWDLQRILWLDDSQATTPYQLTTVTYGTRSAPFLALRVLLQLVKDEGERFPKAIAPLTQGRYVDDICGGSDHQDELIEVARQVIGLRMAGGSPITKWQTNLPNLLSNLNVQPLLTQEHSFDNCQTKLLGLRWNPTSDLFTYQAAQPTQESTLTKRIILSEIAQLYDPLGFLSPFIIRAKVLLQELWLEKLSWDDALSPQVCHRWAQFREELQLARELTIPRWLHLDNSASVEFHGFSDASQLAMAAVIYLRVHSSKNGTTAHLVCSKTKVAPLKRLTIPRLELSAAVMLTKLIRHVQQTLQLAQVPVYLWTDSSITSTWIKAHPSRWKDFVQNRVSLIQELSPNSVWRFVPGTVNPADCASRGLAVTQLKSHALWWTGPPWLVKPSSSWPNSTLVQDLRAQAEERPGLSLVVVSTLDYSWDLISRYSSLTRLLRITALCFRAYSILKRIPRSTLSTPLSPRDLEKARLFWIKDAQAAAYSHDIKQLWPTNRLPPTHPFSRLTAFIDTQGIIRVGGRLDHSTLCEDNKHPAILPAHSRFTQLVISDAHERTLHGGTQLTLNHTRQHYWILGGRIPVKALILRCIRCARFRGKRAQQLMGQLPSSRLTPSRAFLTAGVDYAGPLNIKAWKGRGAKQHKGWICVFVCFVTSAIHLEVVSDYSSDSFLSAFRRFTGRRGICQTLYSDCGTTFIGADASLKKLFTQGSQEFYSLSSTLADDGTQWKFNPPSAPHMGGKWEAAVKSVKHHLYRTIGEALLTFEELTTLLVQIEAVLNSRPLEPLTNDPDDVTALTPGHFLIGTALTALPEPSLTEVSQSRLSRWQLIQQRLQYFWSRWSASYLQRLQAISKWHHPSNELKVGSLVLITDERFPPCKWPLARVMALHPGQDGLTRVVSLKTATSTLTRPITKLAILPVTSSDHSTS